MIVGVFTLLLAKLILLNSLKPSIFLFSRDAGRPKDRHIGRRLLLAKADHVFMHRLHLYSWTKRVRCRTNANFFS
jgi:hypothetical protein